MANNLIGNLDNDTGEIQKFIRETPMFIELIKRFKQKKDIIEKNNIDESSYDMINENSNTQQLKDKFNAMSDLYMINNKLKNLIETKVKYLIKINGKNELDEASIIVKYRDAIEQKMNNIYNKEETYPTGLIPNQSEIKFDYGKGDGNGIIIIVPGSVQMVQSEERIIKLIHKLKDFKLNEKLETIKYIVFSGRGNISYNFKEVEELTEDNIQLKDSELERYIKDNSNDISTLSLLTQKDIGDKKVLKKMNPKFKFKTEARMMIEIFEKIIQDDTQLKDSYELLISKVYGEHLAMETAANFVLAPLAISNDHRKLGSNGNKQPLETIMNDFQTADLYFVSSDYHIYRCVSIIIQLFAHTKIQGNIYALNSKVEKHGSKRILRFAELGSMYQPYEQLTLDICGNMDIQFKEQSDQQQFIKANYSDIVLNTYNTVFRLLTMHGFYNRYNDALVIDWQKLFREYYPEVLEKIGLYKREVLSGGSRTLVNKNNNSQPKKAKKSKHPKSKRKYIYKKNKKNTKINNKDI
jgi:hypothetical protein